MTDKYNEFVPIDKFLGMNPEYENPNQILEILDKPLDPLALKQPDYEEFLSLPVNPDYEKQKEENEVLLRQRTEYVASEEHQQKVYEENVKIYEDMAKELSLNNVVDDDTNN
jgi:hypothetical protein